MWKGGKIGKMDESKGGREEEEEWRYQERKEEGRKEVVRRPFWV